MKRIVWFGLLALATFGACTNDEQETKAAASENDVDAARNFIRAALDGKWGAAKNYMLQDSTNVQLLERAESMYQTQDREEKRGYRESTINLYDTRQAGDSITIVKYSNSFKKKMDSLKVVRLNGQWVVDLKYSLLANDSTHNVQ
jgi:hypothetical protein